MFTLANKFLKEPRAESGFTLMEVIVAALMIFLFVIGSMQALALAAALRVKAQASQRATQLIQEDIEQIRFAAENLAEDRSRCSANGYTGGYAEALVADANFPEGSPTKNLIEGNTDSTTYELERTIDTDNSTNTVLRVSYRVLDSDTDKEIATNYTEIIPDAAIQCP